MIDMLPLLDWTSFVYFALPTVVLLAASATLAIMSKRYWAIAVGVAAVLVLALFIGGMWHSLERPPMRTMGETRLWYSLFVIIAGLIVFIRWRYGWILSFSGVLSTVFMAINVFKPEIHNKTMMPALESPFFVPHVISYIFAYSILAAAVLVGIYILLGAVWAKQAWGTYWGWDPKETWAAITLLSYLLYIHHRLYAPRRFEVSFALLILSFLFLQICWYGVNYLPAAQGSSIHTYGM
jgi:cytochrome c biogenesis protein